MNANKLANELDKCSCVYYDSTTNQYFDDVELSSKAADMLRQQAQEIEQLKEKAEHYEQRYRDAVMDLQIEKPVDKQLRSRSTYFGNNP